MNSKADQEKAQADPMAEGSTYDHKTGVLTEPGTENEPKVIRNQVDPVRDPKLFEEEMEDAPIPRRGDPFAHQRDEKAAEAGAKEQAKEDEKTLKAKDKSNK